MAQLPSAMDAFHNQLGITLSLKES